MGKELYETPEITSEEVAPGGLAVPTISPDNTTTS
jgi:hypothetical protein